MATVRLAPWLVTQSTVMRGIPFYHNLSRQATLPARGEIWSLWFRRDLVALSSGKQSVALLYKVIVPGVSTRPDMCNQETAELLPFYKCSMENVCIHIICIPIYAYHPSIQNLQGLSLIFFKSVIRSTWIQMAWHFITNSIQSPSYFIPFLH